MSFTYLLSFCCIVIFSYETALKVDNNEGKDKYGCTDMTITDFDQKLALNAYDRRRPLSRRHRCTERFVSCTKYKVCVV